jgi:DNA-binding NarL/FixJ family response regulator
LLARHGLSDAEIALRQGVEVKTVRNRMWMVRRKMGCANRTQVAVRVLVLGWVGLEEISIRHRAGV